MCEEGIDGLRELQNAAKDTAPNALVGDLAKESLHEIAPRRGGGEKVQVKAPMARQPPFDPLVLVGGVVVHDEMNVEASRGLMVDLIEET